jgi:type II secretory pathway component PulL
MKSVPLLAGDFRQRKKVDKRWTIRQKKENGISAFLAKIPFYIYF